jgi:hypothetical protein
MTITISLPMAREMALTAQGLDGGWALPPGKEGVAQTVERLGYVQIDTIAVIERAHHHVLWTRCPGYDPDMLNLLLSQDRRVFEYWTHAASYVPMAHYRYYLRRMRAAAGSARHHRWCAEHPGVVDHVLGRIREEGVLASSDFEAPDDFKRGTWWNWKPAKRALEMLFDTGELMIAGRRNFQRLYDLRERVLPDWVDTTEPPEDEEHRFRVSQTLSAQGIAALRDLRHSRQSMPVLQRTLDELQEAGEVVAVSVEGLKDTYYIPAAALEEVDSPTDGATLHLLSPFDNAIIWRDRLARLFGFDYSLECYVPQPKRRYGYFTLPILWGGRFVGRLDPKADRKARTLIVRSLVLEPDAGDVDTLLPALAARLHAFCTFNGCDNVAVEATQPAGLLALLNRALQEVPPVEDSIAAE